MSFSNPNTNIEYIGDGATDRYAINFHVFENSFEISAKVYDVTDPSSPVEVVIAYSIDHTNYPASEVVFVSPVPDQHVVIIERDTDISQTTNFAKGAFPAEAVEEAIDRAIMIAQENAADIGRAVLNPLVGPTIEERLEDLEADSGTTEADVMQLQADMVQAQADIDQAELAITALQLNDATQDTDIDNLQSDMVQAQADIVALQAAIGASTLTVLDSTQVYALSPSETVIVKADDVTLNLPAETAGTVVEVKMDNFRLNCIINSAAGIDGFGVAYTLTSNYESVKLVADGTQWYIL